MFSKQLLHRPIKISRQTAGGQMLIAAIRRAFTLRYRSLGRVLFVASLLTGAYPPSANAQEVTPDSLADDSSALADNDTDNDADNELDKMLNMDLDQLSNTSVVVVATDTNPVVEGVSKKEETVDESPGIVQVITSDQIEAFGAKNLKDVLQWATSVYMTGSYLYPNNSISMRGDLSTHNTNHVLPLINGRPFRDVHNSGLNTTLWMSFPLDAIDHIEVIRGPGSVLYGSSAYVGVINIVTKKGKGPRTYAKALAGEFGTQQYSVSVSNGDKQKGYLISGVYNRQEGWPFTATGEAITGLQPTAVTDSMNIGNDNVGLLGQFYYDNWNVTTFFSNMNQSHLGSLPVWPGSNNEVQNHESQRVFVDIGYLWEHDNDAKTDMHFTYNYHRSEWFNPFPTYFPAHSYLLEATHFRPLSSKVDLIVGSFVDLQNGHQGTDTVAPWQDTWVGVYGQLEYQATDWLKLIGGIQGNMPGEQEGGVSPRAGALFTLTDRLTTKFLYGEAFRSGSPVERLVNTTVIPTPPTILGNPDLIPETIATFEHQIAYTADELRIAGTFFYSTYNNIIGRVGASPATYENNGKKLFRGYELESQYHLDDRLMFMGAVTWQENIDQLGAENTTLVPNWQGKFGLAYNSGEHLEIGLFHTVFSKPASVASVNPAVAIVNTPESSINLLSLNMQYDVSNWIFGNTCRKCGPRAKLQLLAENLLDEDINHPEFSRKRINTLPMGGGRAFYGGFSVDY